MLSMTPTARLGCALALGLASFGALAQPGAKLTDKDYARAERFMVYNTRKLVDHDVRRVHWLGDSQFWYVDTDHGVEHYMRMNAGTGKAEPAFDADKLAAALNAVIDGKKDSKAKPIKAGKLPISDMTLPKQGHFQVTVRGTEYTCDLSAKAECVKGNLDAVLAGHKADKGIAALKGVVSPDGKQVAFIRDWNLWVRDIATGKERQLTHDGVKNYGYATDNAGWVHSDQAVLVWSPDSKKIATFQQDQRKVGDMAIVGAAIGHPKIEVWKYPLVGDKHVPMIHRVVIDVPGDKVVRLKMKPDFHRSTLCDDISCFGHGAWEDVKWSKDSQSLAFVSTSRGHKHEWFRIANPETGAVRTVFEESVPTYYESGIEGVNWRYLSKAKQAIWPSECSNWNQLYLYSLRTGKMLHPITTGKGNVSDVLHLDRSKRQVWFTAVGREKGVNPYYRQLWKASLNGGKATLLTPEKADHSITMSPDGRYFVDSYSTPTTPPVTVLRASSDGHVIATVARADISRLKAAGWVPPIPFTVTARDGKTKLYGMMFKPTHFDPHKKYPLVDYVYPGPQTGSVRGRSFSAARGDHQAMAELGFIVIALDGMGTPWRSKAFHNTWYGDMGDNTLPDQVKGIKELAKRYSWIDLNRVGIWGHSGGGNTTADALFRYPDFFKVGWAESGNHDNRNYEADWGEKYQGLLKKNKDGSTNYDNQSNPDIAKQLKGHLMLTYGTLDDNVPPENTQMVVQALIKANRDFDMIAIPNVHHGYGYATPYITRRRWDYFVRYLAGDTPPSEYKLKAWPWY
ncbi:S9 family peptidase [Oleiagrimonas sp. C23AA]|uniref:S9 family peptidase n=1 Tax=Oleiagrimonas sp. C23AA TaxID=2719047 RepID=UPI0014247BE6|nr:S9 family peptidase [Oleiagrimonas sp. C23AA]NII11242.1 prolyl oligopeptidase family serine peptidase [Oleiagrimonas sp. C23AA]